MEIICKIRKEIKKEYQTLTYFAIKLKKTLKNRIFDYVIVKLQFHSFFSIKPETYFFTIKYRISTISSLWMYIIMLNRVKYVKRQHDYCLKLCNGQIYLRSRS